MRARSLLSTIVLLFGMGTVPMSPAHSREVVKGSITQDTTWTKAKSPYILRGDVIVEEGATLTIEPGVQVDGGEHTDRGHGLVVKGTLRAEGTLLEPIRFFGDPWRGIWFVDTDTDLIRDDRSVIANATIEGGFYGIHISGDIPRIEGVGFYFNYQAVQLTNPKGEYELSANTFAHNDLAIGGWTRDVISIRANDFINNRMNLVPRPQPAYDCGEDDGRWEIHNNDILRGQVNQRFYSYDVRTPPGSGVSDYSVDATSNYWGTTEENRIVGRFSPRSSCCPKPVTKEIAWKPFATLPQTPKSFPLLYTADPAPVPRRNGDPAFTYGIDSAVHGECIGRWDFQVLGGFASDGLSEVRRVRIALRGPECRWWDPSAARLVERHCQRPLWFEPTGLRRWSYAFPKTLPAGRYIALVGTGSHYWMRGDLGRDRVHLRLLRSLRPVPPPDPTRCPSVPYRAECPNVE